jgi:hypothetical protein
MAAGTSAPATQAPSGGGNAAGSGGTSSGGAADVAQAVVPFVRGTGKGKYRFYSKSGLTLTTVTQDLGPVDVKAYDYMRALLVTCTTTAVGGTTGTAQADAPFNLFTTMTVSQPNGQTMYQTSSGFHAAMIQKYGFYRAQNDPRTDPNFLVTGSWATFAIRIPFELDLRDALGALPNKDAAAPFQVDVVLNTLANVFGANISSSPTFTVEIWLEAYDQPPQTLNGMQVQTTPPNMNTLQRWTEQNITMSTGQFDARVRKLGNYVRLLIPIMKNNSSVRIGGVAGGTAASLASTNWADPVQIVLDEDVKDNISMADWFRRTWEIYGYGSVFPGTLTTVTAGVATAGNATGVTPLEAQDSPFGVDTGVFPIPYFCDTRDITERVEFYLPTIESEDYLLRGSWGSNCSKLVMLVCEVLPQGDIFG